MMRPPALMSRTSPAHLVMSDSCDSRGSGPSRPQGGSSRGMDSMPSSPSPVNDSSIPPRAWECGLI
eukprot:CAMPEP_0197916018 /NCGR_PEP_ID=MMETSP1439-20131203/81221_1 /TAXON_ID=66791 /ORGANISM="Gonyaulax spinifera, Strain CCMP409" /LENGTH=65 /DNA_ID=CAMNT_0043538007 /DNA_START=328 /DNA_END=522 /DNA_ORIENTATION=-